MKPKRINILFYWLKLTLNKGVGGAKNKEENKSYGGKYHLEREYPIKLYSKETNIF